MTKRRETLRFVRSRIHPRAVLVNDKLDLVSLEALRKRAKRTVDFVIIDADTGEDVTRIVLA